MTDAGIRAGEEHDADGGEYPASEAVEQPVLRTNLTLIYFESIRYNLVYYFTRILSKNQAHKTFLLV